MTEIQPQNSKRITIPEYLWDLFGACIGALIGGAAGAACGVGLSFALRDWIIVPVASLGGVVVGGLVGYFAGGSAAFALDVYGRIIGKKSRVPIYVGLAAGAVVLVRVIMAKEGTWPVAIGVFTVFCVIGYAIASLFERGLALVKLIKSR